MKIKGIISEDFINYKKPSLVIEFPYCDFKCDKESGMKICQNENLAQMPNIEISIPDLFNKYYFNNPITKAIIFQGLEPFDSFNDVLVCIQYIRNYTQDDIIIYTGYTKQELIEKQYLKKIKQYNNIIIKYGRFIPNQKEIFDNILGIKLASNNQYAEKL